MENVSEYICLGQKIQLGINNQSYELARSVRQCWLAFDRMGFISISREIPINLKPRVFDSCILPVFTYGLEIMGLKSKST